MTAHVTDVIPVVATVTSELVTAPWIQDTEWANGKNYGNELLFNRFDQHRYFYRHDHTQPWQGKYAQQTADRGHVRGAGGNEIWRAASRDFAGCKGSKSILRRS